MFNPFTKKPAPTPSGLEITIDELRAEMHDLPGDTDEYTKMADNLVKLLKAREYDTPRRVSPDAMVAVVGNIVAVVLIVGHERAHVVTSKAIAFVSKLK